MSEWHVSASESEGEEEGMTKEETGVVELGGLKIPASRIVELLQAVENRSTTELVCLSEFRRKRHGHRKKKHRRSHAMGGSPTHGSGVKSTEEVSETTSDVRSTTSTNITTECRDTRRHDFTKFDPSLDPELDDDLAMPTRVPTLSTRKAPPNHLKEKKLASLEKITADSIRRKQRWHHQLQQEINNVTEGSSSVTSTSFVQNSKNPSKSTSPQTDLHTGNRETFYNDRDNRQGPYASEEDMSMMEVDGVGGSEREPQGLRREHVDLPSFRFDEDSDGEMNSSEVDMKHSILSQINRVENLLDTEALT